MADRIDKILSWGSDSVEETISDLDNEMEAQILDDVLNENSIPHMIKPYGDTPYATLFELAKGWGFVRAPEEYKETILGYLEDIRRPENYTDDAAKEAMGNAAIDDAEAFIEAEDEAVEAKEKD